MRWGRLISISAVFIGLSVSADAQYTTKSASASSGFTTKTTAARPVAETTSTTKANPYTGKANSGDATTTNSYTNSNKAAAAPTQATAPAQAVFRPRPQEAQTASSDDDDELPSFDALEGKPTQKANVNAPLLPPSPPPKGEIWVYITDFKYRDLTGSAMVCDWKVVVQNKTSATIEQMEFTYNLLDLGFFEYVYKLKSGETYTGEAGSPSKKCPSMTRAKPKIIIKKCKLADIRNQDCMKYIVVK